MRGWVVRWVAPYAALLRERINIFNISIVVDVGVDLTIFNEQVELVDLISILSGYLCSQVSKGLEVADVRPLEDPVFRVHCVHHINLDRSDARKARELGQLLLQGTNTFVALQEKGKQRDDCFLVALCDNLASSFD